MFVFSLECPLAEPNRGAITVGGRTQISYLRNRYGRFDSKLFVSLPNKVLRVHCAVFGGASQLYFLHTNSGQKQCLGFIDLQSNQVSVTGSPDLTVKGEVSAYAMGALRCLKRHVFVVVGRHHLIQSCEFHAYDIVDQYWERLQDIPFGQSALSIPMVTAIDRGEDSYLYVSSNEWMQTRKRHVLTFGSLRMFRKNLGQFLYSPWEKIELGVYPSSPNFCVCANNDTDIIVLGKMGYNMEVVEVYFGPD